MLRLCFLLSLAATIYLADCGFDLQDVKKVRISEVDNMKREMEKKLEELLAVKALQSVELEIQSQDEAGNIEAEKTLDAMTPQEVQQMETDNMWGDDGSEPLPELLQHIYKEWEQLILRRDPEYIVDKYSEDCIYIFKEDGKSKTVVGREGVKALYRTWFDQYDYFRAKVDPDTVKGKRLGHRHLLLINDVKFYHENGGFAGAVTNTVILKHVPASKSVNDKGGFEVMLISEVRDDSD